MSTFGEDLIQSLNEALAHAKGEGPAIVHAPISPREVRRQAKLTQMQMAALIGMSLSGYRKWEQGRRRVSGPAATLLRVIEHDPNAVKHALMPPRYGSFSGRLWKRDLFARDHPASLEGPPQAWALAEAVIDHGCFLFSTMDSFRAELGLRDLVVQALFRRILITSEAIRSLLVRGLEEPAFATFRTLLELERDLRLVIADPSDTRARRLALFLAVKGRRNFAKATKNRDARNLLKGDSGFFDWFRGKSRSFRQWTESEGFQDVADELNEADHWHGLNNQQEAFEKVGMATAYHVEYGGSSLFVHGGNVEHDFASADGKKIRFKPLAQRDPAHTLVQLGRLTHSVLMIFRLIWEDRGKPEYQESFEVEAGDRCFDVNALDALTAQAINIFPNPRSS